MSAWRLLGEESRDIRAMVSLPVDERSPIPYVLVSRIDPPQGCTVPYFASDCIYFIDDGIMHETSLRNSLWLPKLEYLIDYTITFDTNFATYVARIVRGKPLGTLEEEVKRAVDHILCHSPNFDHLFYMIENIKVAYPVVLRLREHGPISPLTFWKSLDNDFRKTIVSLQLFRSIDPDHYRNTLSFRFSLPFAEAVRNSIEDTFGFYASSEGQEFVEYCLHIQRAMLLQLLAMLRIQLSSNSGPRKKINEFLEFVQHNVGAYFDRETIIAHEYFKKNRNLQGFFGKVTKGSSPKGLWDTIDNMAWDMAAARFMEQTMRTTGQGRYIVPFFLTFDRRLRGYMKVYSVKAVLIHKETGDVLSVPVTPIERYFRQERYYDTVRWFFSEQTMTERLRNLPQTTEILLSRIDSEYSALCATLRPNE